MGNSATHTPFTATTTADNALPANVYRLGLVIQNKGSDVVYVRFGGTADASTGLEVAASGRLQWEGVATPVDAVSIVAASGSQAVLLVETHT